MIVIGIDPGTATTGYGIVEENNEGKLNSIDYGVIVTPASAQAEMRLKQIYENLQAIILLHRPDYGSVEKLFFQKNVTNAIAVGQARGVVMLAFANAQIPIFEYTPNEVKQSVTGYGSADKKQVQIMTQTILGLPNPPKPDDAADALAVAICHIHSYGYQRLLDRNEI